MKNAFLFFFFAITIFPCITFFIIILFIANIFIPFVHLLLLSFHKYSMKISLAYFISLPHSHNTAEPNHTANGHCYPVTHQTICQKEIICTATD